MPELPEVETSRRGIEPHLVGATILHAVVRNGRLRWPVSEEIYRLSDQPVLSVQRRAKYLLLELPEGYDQGMEGFYTSVLRQFLSGTAGVYFGKRLIDNLRGNASGSESEAYLDGTPAGQS